jgi:hypothetical protein
MDRCQIEAMYVYWVRDENTVLSILFKNMYLFWQVNVKPQPIYSLENLEDL